MNERLIGTVSRGVRAPIIRQGDDIAKIVTESVLSAAESENLEIHDRDVVAVTEAVVATMHPSIRLLTIFAPNSPKALLA